MKMVFTNLKHLIEPIIKRLCYRHCTALIFNEQIFPTDYGVLFYEIYFQNFLDYNVNRLWTVSMLYWQRVMAQVPFQTYTTGS